MKTILASCGKFHYGNYAEILAERKVLAQYVFAHKIGTFRGRPWARNLWLKEYVMYGLFGLRLDRFSDTWLPLLHSYWDARAAAVLSREGAILHVMLHGTSLRLMRKAREYGMFIIGEAVNAHPDQYFQINRDQHAVLGLPFPLQPKKQTARIRIEAQACDLVLCPSATVRDSYVERGIPSAKTRVLPYGVDLVAFSPPTDWSHRGSEVADVLCACQIIPRKGVHVLLSAWRRLPTGVAARLTVAGRCPSGYRTLIQELPEGVTYVGSKDRAGLIDAMRLASIFVLPTFEDGFAVVVLEAMATGCVVITTSAAGAAEIIESGVDGVVIPPGDPVVLADKLSWLISNPEERIRMGKRAVTKAQSLNGWNGYTNGLIQVYRQSIQDAKK